MPKGYPKNGVNKGWFKKNHISKTKGRRSYNPICLYCGKYFDTSDKRNKFCSHSCAMKYLWKTGLMSKEKLLESGFNTRFKKGEHPSLKTEFKKGDGRITGINNHNWKGGITSLNEMVRKSSEWKKWRESVFARDNWTCQHCNSRGIFLHPHHKKPVATCIKTGDLESIFDINNGLSLCVECHRDVHRGGK